MVRLAPFVLAALCAVAPLAPARDWPQWRFDARHSASSLHELPATLHLQWVREWEPREPVWEDSFNQDILSYDRCFEPVVADGRMFVPFNDRDRVVALDAATGERLWCFYAEGPVRLPPVAHDGRVYFTSDDGHLYCVGAASGRLLWKVRGGPTPRKVLGNQRLISTWPARGGPVVADGVVFFAAGIWPFQGVFVQAVDAASGEVLWENDTTGSQYLVQPHGAPAFGGIAPQGPLVATEQYLLVPGRTLPALLDRRTGEVIRIAFDPDRGVGGSFVAATDSEYFVHTSGRMTRSLDLATGQPKEQVIHEPVLAGDRLFAAAGEWVQVIGPGEDRHKWLLDREVTGDTIRAGGRLYVGCAGAIVAVRIPSGDESPRIEWSAPVESDVLRLLAASDRLFAATADGRILAFGAKEPGEVVIHREERIAPREAEQTDDYREVLAAVSDPGGYALLYGLDDAALLDVLLQETSMHVVAVDPDTRRVQALRRKWDAAGLLGDRLSLHVDLPGTFEAPPYLAHLVAVGKGVARQLRGPADLAPIWRSVRPYGGVLFARSVGEELSAERRWPGFAPPQMRERPPVADGTLLVRTGPLPGAGSWTHMYGDVANSVKSDDSIVHAPLGLLWFGGVSNDDVLPRHGHGPPQQVIGGRLFIEGDASISARDVYTGRVLWKTGFEALGNYGVYFDETHLPTPENPLGSQRHIPGANARGTNFVATEDGVYVVLGSECHLLDVESGEAVDAIAMPEGDADDGPPDWGFLGVAGEVLLGGRGFVDFSSRLGIFPEIPPPVDRSASRALVAFDPFAGEVLWEIEAHHGFVHNGIVASGGRVYCLDRVPATIEAALRERGITDPEPARIVALDLDTGDVVWEVAQEVFGTWLGYSQEHDLVLQAGARLRDRLEDEVGQGMVVHRGADGSVQWEQRDLTYTGPCILHGDWIVTNVDSRQTSAGAFHLLDGSRRTVENPFTLEPEPWRFTRDYGCNAVIASERLLTFRSGAASYYDLERDAGTGNIGGLRSGCTSNLIVADGVLNAPDYTRTCVCLYQNQTSLALVPTPDAETWSVTQFDVGEGARIRRLGINFGAPGDRRDEAGTLWLEHPIVAGHSPAIAVEVDGEKLSWFQRHPLHAAGEGHPWVTASGAQDLHQVRLHLGPAATVDTATPGQGSPSVGSSEESAADVVLYTVRLHFAEPEDRAPGKRVFDVSVQGERVIQGLDIARESGGRLHGLVREIQNVTVRDVLVLELTPTSDSAAGPVLSGLEVIAQD